MYEQINRSFQRVGSMGHPKRVSSWWVGGLPGEDTLSWALNDHQEPLRPRWGWRVWGGGEPSRQRGQPMRELWPEGKDGEAGKAGKVGQSVTAGVRDSHPGLEGPQSRFWGAS